MDTVYLSQAVFIYLYIFKSKYIYIYIFTRYSPCTVASFHEFKFDSSVKKRKKEEDKITQNLDSFLIHYTFLVSLETKLGT